MLAIILWEADQGGGNITWMLWVALGFFALMVVVGWLSSRGKKADNETPEAGQHSDEEQH